MKITVVIAEGYHS